MASSSSSPSPAPPPSYASPVEKGTSGFHAYSPISTLERQYAPPVGQRLYMFVRPNVNACLAGGVESALKIRQSNSNNNSTAAPPMNNSISGEQQQQQQRANGDNLAASYDNNNNGSDDPFSFLGQEADGAVDSSIKSTTSTTSSSSNSGRGPNIGRFLKKVAQNTTQKLERGMTNLAIRADGGKSPDLLVLGLYDESTLRTNNTSLLLGMTESKPLPDAQQRFNGVRFEVPLVVPGSNNSSSSSSSNNNTEESIVIKLWIRSGAALLQGTVAAKNYLLGTAHVPVKQLRQSLTTTSRCTFLTLSLQSALVVDGKLDVCIVPDLKFPPLCGRGWTLADPEMKSGGYSGMFNLPLDQSYGFNLPSTNNSSTACTCVASERAIESTVVLPIATAFMQLAGRASQISLTHATSVASRVYAARHDSFVGEYADVNVRIGSLKVSSTTTTGSSTTTTTASTPFGDVVQQQTAPSVAPPPPSSAFVSMSWQRPDSIFEVDLLHPTRLPTSTSAPPSTAAAEFVPTVATRFYPKPVRERILPSILQACGGRLPSATGFLLGNVRLLITIPRSSGGSSSSSSAAANAVNAENPFAPTTATGTQAAQAMATDEEQWECIIALEGLLVQPPAATNNNGAAAAVRPPVLEYPVYHTVSGQQMGTLVIQIDLKMYQGQPVPPKAAPSHGGLVSLVGLTPLCEGINPDLDFDLSPLQQQQNPNVDQRRQQQLSTMGVFVTHAYMDQHVKTLRTTDCTELQERATKYRAALTTAATATPPPEQRLPPHQDRTPKPFRPSSSRMERLLSGIAFNAHTATLSLNVMDPENTSSAATTNATAEPLGDVFYNITCGAPADHARGFASVFPKDMSPNIGLNSPVGVVSGGLRRLEAKRLELAKHVTDMQTTLIMQVANFFVMSRQHNPRKQINHVPGQNRELQELRWKLFEAVQSLHHVTWICATRRANVFSQALGLAVTSYLASMSDSAKWQSSWPSLWAQHGYLVSFEGLLSAAGKELGMIEDASVGIDMLRMVKAVFVPDGSSSSSSSSADAEKVPVVFSPYLKWIRLTPTIGPPGSMTEFTLELGVVQSYFNQRIPEVLKNGTPVRFYSLLFEVGVDIRQFGAHAGSNMTKQVKQRLATTPEGSQQGQPSQTLSPSSSREFSPSDSESGGGGGGTGATIGGLLDDEDDDIGVQDDDVLVQLNYEAFQKLNAYAHLISHANSPASSQKIHPLLETLHQHIVSSSGKMNHDILDEAALLSQQLGGGGVVFCKSGKDRTAMHWTYKASQVAMSFRQRGQSSAAGQQQQTTPFDAAASTTDDTTLEDATMLRVYGTRLPICEKNVGQAKYAFNSLQVKFMPDALKPPMNTLAGFLKGGKVFSGGGIES